jgi:hypothetical protein
METLEEAAEKYNLNTINAFGDYESFIAGAKWQQERSYSEEDMRECWMACLGFNKPDKFNSRVKFEQWFEIFSR